MASKSRPTTEAPPSRPAASSRREEGVDEGLERVGGDVERHGDVVPPGGEHAAAEAVGGREADGVEKAVQTVPAGRQRLAGGAQLLGRGDVDLQDFGLPGQLAGGAPGEAERPSRPREDDLGALLLGQAGHREGQRRIGEDARDQKPLAVQESHCARERMRM